MRNMWNASHSAVEPDSSWVSKWIYLSLPSEV